MFVVDSLAGRLVVGARLDYETTASYTLTVRAQDPQRHAATATVTITVTDVADALAAPTNLTATPAATSLALAWDAVPDARATAWTLAWPRPGPRRSGTCGPRCTRWPS